MQKNDVAILLLFTVCSMTKIVYLNILIIVKLRIIIPSTYIHTVYVVNCFRLPLKGAARRYKYKYINFDIRYMCVRRRTK